LEADALPNACYIIIGYRYQIHLNRKKKIKHNLAKGKPDAADTHCENSEKISSFGSSFPYIHNVTVTQSGKTTTIAQLLTQTTSH